MATTPRTLRSDEQACNEYGCGAVFRVRKPGGASTYGAKGVSLRADEVDPMDPKCPKHRRKPKDSPVWAAAEAGYAQAARARQTGATVEQLDAEQAAAEAADVCSTCGNADCQRSGCKRDTREPIATYVGTGNSPEEALADLERSGAFKDAAEKIVNINRARKEREQGAGVTDAKDEGLNFGHTLLAHHRTDRGRCYCGKFCHTFGQGDDRKLAMHITRSNNDAKEKTWIVKAMAVEIIHVGAATKEEAIRKVKARDFEGESIPRVTFTARRG